MKNLVTLIICIITFINFSQAQNSLIYRDNIEPQIGLNNSVSLNDLYYQSKEFRDVKRLGSNYVKSCESSPVDEICIFEFPGMKITFINLNGEFELSELEITKGHILVLNKNQIPFGKESVGFLKGKSENLTLNSFKDSSKLTLQEKYNNTYKYLEIFKNSDDEIEKIIYKRSLL